MGTLKEIAKAKRADLDTYNAFQAITGEFNLGLKDIDLLFNLVEELRDMLIDKNSGKLAGALKKTSKQFNATTEAYENVVLSDPFEERVAKWEELSESLLTVLEDFAQKARERLGK
ncbi:hypothetical protein EV178_006667 [Coemansia sp. RSA 1646]|nr:hypothetical protein EV178_006667 [Coemansia sp. RSA 1646]KAJ2209449.1 hypothetical protein EV179_006582 [Coemansia sp. RSA 487]